MQSNVYINTAVQISCQKPLAEAWLQGDIVSDPVEVAADNEGRPMMMLRTMEPDFRKYFNALQGRRYSALLKRALVCAREARETYGADVDGVVTGTGLGCIADTEIFMNAIYDNGETLLKPTHFMQSTHNTVGSAVAIDRKIKGYNCTYSQKGLSFDSALYDAFLAVASGDSASLMVCAFEEVSPAYLNLLTQTGYLGAPGQVPASETSVAMVVGADGNDALCRLDAVTLATRPDGIAALLRSRPGALVAVGLNGSEANDTPYRRLLEEGGVDPDCTVTYRNVFGENYGVSALGVYAMAHCLRAGRVPAAMSLSGHEIDGPENIVLINHSEGRSFSAVSLSRC